MQDINSHSETFEHKDAPFDSGSVIERIRTVADSLKGELDLQVVCSERGYPVSNAMISIDSIGMTAVCDQLGRVCLNALPPGRYYIDVISAGYIAQSVLVSIQAAGAQKLLVKMISNI